MVVSSPCEYMPFTLGGPRVGAGFDIVSPIAVRLLTLLEIGKHCDARRGVLAESTEEMAMRNWDERDN